MKVTCIKNPIPIDGKWYNIMKFPIEDNTYTVRKTMVYPSGKKAFLLEEIENDPIEFQGKLIEPGFPTEYFANAEDWIEAQNIVHEVLTQIKELV